MKKTKQILVKLLIAVMLILSAVPAYAAGNAGFSDVAANAWYADAVAYVQENGLMSGTTSDTFSPDTYTSRAMLAAILYRAAGSPSVSASAVFSDVASGAYYANAVAWAQTNGIVSGYSSGAFGSNDPVTREQLVTILWRYAGSPAADAGQPFEDESSIADFASTAVNWSRANGVVNGDQSNNFNPKGNATRAQVATILKNYLTMDKTSDVPSTPDIPNVPDTNVPDTENTKIAVVYFSATGSTEAVAETIAHTLNADLHEINPEIPYTSADLNYNDASSRVNDEHSNPDFRPAIAGEPEDFSEYDMIFLGYPIWWGEAPNILLTFLEESGGSLAGKTVIPFCTSASSGLGSSDTNLHSYAPDADWQSGQRFSSGASASTVTEWVKSLNI